MDSKKFIKTPPRKGHGSFNITMDQMLGDNGHFVKLIKFRSRIKQRSLKATNDELVNQEEWAVKNY